MIFKIKNILYIFLIVTNYSYSQDQIITTPTIESPEEEFISVFQKEKLSNPVFLNGNVKEVTKKVIEHITPNRETSTQENYSYNLNRQKQVIKYSSDIEFDEMKPELLNIEKEVIIKGDTIINHDNIWYNFKKGRLITKTEKKAEISDTDSFMDSISFKYKNNKLVEITHYRRDVLTQVDESKELIEYRIAYSDYDIFNYNKINYDANDLLVSKLTLSTYEDLVFVTKTRYQYNDFNKLESFTRSLEEYSIELIDRSDYIKVTQKHNRRIESLEKNRDIAKYTYDDKKRVTKLIIEKAKEEKHIYSIQYNKNKTFIDYSNNGNTEMQYQYVYDKKNNPIQEKRYVYIDGKKYLDTSITLNIKYY